MEEVLQIKELEPQEESNAHVNLGIFNQQIFLLRATKRNTSYLKTVYKLRLLPQSLLNLKGTPSKAVPGLFTHVFADSILLEQNLLIKIRRLLIIYRSLSLLVFGALRAASTWADSMLFVIGTTNNGIARRHFRSFHSCQPICDLVYGAASAVTSSVGDPPVSQAQIGTRGHDCVPHTTEQDIVVGCA